jgi:hypothetical protein
MALRQLAGPFDLVNITGGFPGGGGGSNMFWWPGLGLIMDIGLSPSTFPFQCCVTFDGVYAELSKFRWVDSGSGWDQERHTRVISQNMSGDILFDQHGLVAVRYPDLKYPLLSTNFVDLRDSRRMYLDLDTIKSYNKITGQTVVESNGPIGWSGSGSGAGIVSPGRDDGELFIANNGSASNPRCCFYDINTKEVSHLMYLSIASLGMVFAERWGVIVSLHQPTTEGTHNQVRIWSLETTPISLTNPVVMDSEDAKAGHVATWMVQALGDRNDPCVDEVITWTLEGKGRLVTRQSKTDVDGKAYTQARFGVYDTGTTTVTASLLC